MKKLKYYTLTFIAIVLIAAFAITRLYNLQNFVMFDKIWHKIYTKITYVEIVGNEIVPTQDIVFLLYNTNIADEFILKNKKQILTLLKENQIIEDVMIKINLPNNMLIVINERKPLLVYHSGNGKLKYVDVNFNEFETNYLNPANFIYVRGKYNKESVKNLIENLKKHSAIYNNLTEIENFAEYRFNIVLNNKMQVLLPEKNIENALKILNDYIVKYNILNQNVWKADFRSKGKVYLSTSVEVKKYKPQPIKIVVYKKESESEKYKQMIKKIMNQL